MNYRRGVDGNHRAVVRALLAAGRSVLDLSSNGGGCPDILVGWGGKMLLMEIKNPENSYGRAGPQAHQADWHAHWKGPPVAVVYSPEEALRATGIETRAGARL